MPVRKKKKEEEIEEKKDEQETDTGDNKDPPGTRRKKKSKGMGLISKGTNTITTLLLCYGVYVAKIFYGICYPTWEEMDENGVHYKKFGNVIKVGDKLHGKLWISEDAFPKGQAPFAEFEFIYDQEGFTPFLFSSNVTSTPEQLLQGRAMQLSAEVRHNGSKQISRAKGPMIKKMKKPDVRPKFSMLNGSQCLEEVEPSHGQNNSHIARGIPQMQVRIVLDQSFYPGLRSRYVPKLFVDEFWMTDDQLVKLNMTGESTFPSEVHFGMMSAARWHFQRHMEASFTQQAAIFGEDSEEMVQMRDLVANTNPTLLTATFVVSLLHIIFEFLAFKNDVVFWQGCDAATLNKFMSVQSIVVGIVMQLLLLLYLWDESANIIVLVTSLVSIVIDAWKVMRAMKVCWIKLFGFLPVPLLEARVKRDKSDNFDSQAMKWLSMLLSPGIVAYGCYTTVYDCHRGWYSLFLTFIASCVYSLGFVLMTPQVFINYKHKTVAFLPWRKFIYRAINTFIDDLFAFIIKMPTMHRLSCFRDDIVFIIYLVQRWQYPVDKDRSFDEDGFELEPLPEGGGEDKKQQ